MHDVLEGVCMYVMGALIHKFIFVKKYVTLELLNEKIQHFEYGSLEKSNRPPIISLNRVKNEMNMKISASKMLCLTRYFGLVMADLIPETDEHWQVYKYLRQILDIVISPRIIRNDAKVLQTLIEQHNSLYLNYVFNFGPLKPKFHHLIIT